MPQQLKVDPAKGLSAAEAQQRLQQYGPNELAAKKKESGWQAFLRQYKDFMQIILLGAAVLSLVVTRDVRTSIMLVVLTIFNAVLGMRGESKAEASLAALEKMMKNIARVRRDGQAIEIEAEQLVPGDIVLMEAGNRVPADGRLFVTATLEIEEAALTGESVASSKDTDAIDKPEVALGDRIMHGLHEHRRHARARRDDRDHHRHGHRDGPHRRPAQQDRVRQDAVAEAARPADHHHRQPGRPGLCPDGHHGSAQRRLLRDDLHRRHCPGDFGHPHRLARGRDHHVLHGHARSWPPWAPSSSGCRRWRRWARSRPSAPTRPAR